MLGCNGKCDKTIELHYKCMKWPPKIASEMRVVCETRQKKLYVTFYIT